MEGYLINQWDQNQSLSNWMDNDSSKPRYKTDFPFVYYGSLVSYRSLEKPVDHLCALKKCWWGSRFVASTLLESCFLPGSYNNRTIQQSSLPGVTSTLFLCSLEYDTLNGAALGSGEVLTLNHDKYTSGTNNKISKTHVYLYTFPHSFMHDLIVPIIHSSIYSNFTHAKLWQAQEDQSVIQHAQEHQYIYSERRK